MLIDLTDINKSEVKYKITLYSSNEYHIILDNLDREKLEYQVRCRINNPNDLYILAQVADILNRNEMQWRLEVLYLMSQREDIIKNFNEALSLKVIANILNTFGCYRISFFDLHSNKIYGMLKMESGGFHFDPGDHLGADSNITICYPNQHSYNKYGFFGENNIIVFDKENITITPEKYITHILIVDELCDEGNDFIKIGSILQEKYPNAVIDIYVRHMITHIGMQRLSEAFNKVYFTNSYKNWENLPENCKMFEL